MLLQPRLLKSGVPPLTNNPHRAFLFQPTASDTSFEDKGPYNRPITRRGNPLLSTIRPDPGGGSRKIMHLTGRNRAGISAPIAPFRVDGVWTIRGWMRREGSGNATLLAGLQNGRDALYIQWLGVTAYVGDASTNPVAVRNPLPRSWQHICAMHDGSYARLFLQGRLIGTGRGLRSVSVNAIEIGFRSRQGHYTYGFITGVEVSPGINLFPASGFTPPSFPLTV